MKQLNKCLVDMNRISAFPYNQQIRIIRPAQEIARSVIQGINCTYSIIALPSFLK